MMTVAELSCSENSPMKSTHSNTLTSRFNQTDEVISQELSAADQLESRIRRESESYRLSKRPYLVPELVARDRSLLPYLTPIESEAHSLSSQSSDPAHNIFLFVNPTSGGNAAATFVEGGLEHARLACPDPVNLWIWDIREGDSPSKPGFVKLRQVVEGLRFQKERAKLLSRDINRNSETTASSHNTGCPDDYIYVIIAGGDGTVVWCITELWAHGVNDEYLALGVVPYGTGNDFARALGWNKFNDIKPFKNNFKVLSSLIHEWLQATPVFHDIWEVNVQTKESGTFQKIDASSRKKKVVEGYLTQPPGILPLVSFCDFLNRLVTMQMYFCSLGSESRIGVGFDRHRSTSHILNKIRYGAEGTKKAFFKKTARPDELIRDFSEDLQTGEEQTKLQIFSALTPSSPKLLCCSSLIASNIPSFAAGLDLWSFARRSGLSGSNPMTGEQRLGDGILEFISFKGVTQMGVERVIRGQGRRVHQGKGPFHMTFNDLSPNIRVYFQVDGEFFIMTVPYM